MTFSYLLHMGIESMVDDKAGAEAGFRIIKNAVENTPAWKSHLKQHKNAKLNIKPKDNSSLYPAEPDNLAKRIGFSGMKQMKSLDGKREEDINWHERREDAKSLGFEDEKQQDDVKKKEEEGGKIYGQPGDDGGPVYGQPKEESGRLYKSTGSSLVNEFTATCGCGQDFTSEGHQALGHEEMSQASAPGYAKKEGGYAGSGAASQSAPGYVKGKAGGDAESYK